MPGSLERLSVSCGKGPPESFTGSLSCACRRSPSSIPPRVERWARRTGSSNNELRLELTETFKTQRKGIQLAVVDFSRTQSTGGRRAKEDFGETSAYSASGFIPSIWRIAGYPPIIHMKDRKYPPIIHMMDRKAARCRSNHGILPSYVRRPESESLRKQASRDTGVDQR